MKRLQTFFIALALFVVIGLLVATMIGASLVYIKLKTTSQVTETFPSYDYMITPIYLLSLGTLLGLIFTMASGLYTTSLYHRGTVFDARMVQGLDRVGLGFLASALFAFFLAFYIYLNTRVWFFVMGPVFTIPILILGALLVFLLADVVERGRILREDNALTI